MGERKVTDAIEKLFYNLSAVEIPINILQQYMPIQYEKVIRNKLTLSPKELAKDGILNVVLDYEYATE